MVWVLALVLLLISGCTSSPSQPAYDLVITGGSLINGEGTPPVAGDIGIRDGKIATMAAGGALASASATRRIDATGLTVAPGFIDMHNHSDGTILVEPKAESMIRQGVT